MMDLLDRVRDIAVRAGERILDVYENEFDVDYKEDGSPLTVADRRAHDLIVSELSSLEPALPVLSEESDQGCLSQRFAWDRYWLVDPLDGTKEFVKRNGEFTVNIALMDGHRPVLGVVFAPVKGTCHYASLESGAFLSADCGPREDIATRPVTPNHVVAVASRSHASPEVQGYLENLKQRFGEVSTLSMGSSLKICLVAEGSADVYPRLGPTSEWDTAAAHCVLEAAGGRLTDIAGNDLTYNKPEILNPWFIAGGDPSVSWTDFLGR